MDPNTTLIGLAGVVTSASPLLFASIGETIGERAGVINLSLNGTIILSAMVSFAAALMTNSLLVGFIAGILVGGFIALIIALASITLRQSQVAVGFVLTLMTASLAYFLGAPYVGVSGPFLTTVPIPLLSQIPILGTVFFNSDILTYISYLVIFVSWFWIFRTRPGLIMQGIGERPAAAFARGSNVNLQRYIYTTIAGMLAGMAGADFSLNVKAGWNGTISGLDGFGWIALAICIFGGWNPARAALGAYLFALLEYLGLVLQQVLPNVPAQVLLVAPFPLMILTLLLVNIGDTEWLKRMLAALPTPTRRLVTRLIRTLSVKPPKGLGVPFEQE
jgi:ABC-type uncharacterized transport system permease subunit